MEDARIIANYIEQELVRLHGPRHGLLGHDERGRLFKAGREFNKRFSVKLMAHGVDSSDFYPTVAIFSQGRLIHSSWQENYGEFGSPYTGLTGHWDFGKGLFVVSQNKLLENRSNPTGQTTYSIPLEDIDAVLFPDEVAEVIRHTFPSKDGIIRGYTSYAQKIENVNTIFDIQKRRNKLQN